MNGELFTITAMGGYKKSEVLAYIEQMEEMNRAYIAKLEDEIKDLKRSAEEKEAAEKNEKESIQHYEAEIQAADERIAELKSEQSVMADSARKIRAELEKKARETEQLFSVNQALREKLQNIEELLKSREEEIAALKKRNEELVLKKSEQHQTQEQIARVLLDARMSADALLLHANEEAEEIRQTAEQRLKIFLDNIGKINIGIADLRERIVAFYSQSDHLMGEMIASSQQLGDEFLRAAAD